MFHRFACVKRKERKKAIYKKKDGIEFNKIPLLLLCLIKNSDERKKKIVKTNLILGPHYRKKKNLPLSNR